MPQRTTNGDKSDHRWRVDCNKVARQCKFSERLGEASEEVVVHRIN